MSPENTASLLTKAFHVSNMPKTVCPAFCSLRLSPFRCPVMPARIHFLSSSSCYIWPFSARKVFIASNELTNRSRTFPQLSHLAAEWRGRSVYVLSSSSSRDSSRDRFTMKLIIFDTVAISSLRSEIDIFAHKFSLCTMQWSFMMGWPTFSSV